MGESTLVARWRETKRQAGLKAVTVWLPSEVEFRLKDLALQWHCAPSEIVQHALAQFQHGRPPSLNVRLRLPQPSRRAYRVCHSV